jgi:hypothetical protein
MAKILYVTSFAKDMYKASGQHLIESYKKHNVEGNLLICYENFNMPKEYKLKYGADALNEKMTVYPLHDSVFLKTWLEDNRDMIPDYLGGDATELNNPDVFLKEHKRKASRFFRKIAAMKYAIDTFGSEYDWIIWIDSDCLFIRKLDNSDVVRIATDKRVAFYHFGPVRRRKDVCYETSVIGFKRELGYELFDMVVKCYTDKSYRQYRRWDDGFIFRMIMSKNEGKYPQVDLVSNKQINSDAIKYSPFGEYLLHNKGCHRRQNILV